MENIAEIIFKDKRPLFPKLVNFGFKSQKGKYAFCTEIPDSGFLLKIEIDSAEKISTEIIDPSFNEPYFLHLAENAKGDFVGKIRRFYKKTLFEIADKCFYTEIFKCAQTKTLIEYVRKTYGDSPEFLWKKSPRNAILRRKDSGKWYGALLTVSKRKLGIESDEMAEILNFRISAVELEGIIDGKMYFPAYHMNKKHWCSAVLDGSIPIQEICQRIDCSYRATPYKKPKPQYMQKI